MSTERLLSVELISLVQQNVVRPVLFVFADFPSGARRLWTGISDISWDGHTWEGVGGAIGFETVSETMDTAAKGVSAKLNGLDSTLVSAIINDQYQGRDAIIYLAFWNDDETELEAMPEPLWRGTLDTDEIEDDGAKSTLTIKAEHRLVDILRKREFRYTDRDQQLLYPSGGDTGLNKVEAIQDLQVPWGRTQK